MKISERWLREWTDPSIDTETLARRLTMAGHEVDGIEVLGAGLDDIVVAEVVQVDAHPNADRLRVCKADVGAAEPVTVVCGAPNVTVGMKTAFVPVGAVLPGGMTIRKAKIRGVESFGMLCSATELSLGSDSAGIIALSGPMSVGEPLVKALRLPDAILDVNLTPNRGDCFSVRGLSRDIAAICGSLWHDTPADPVAATTDLAHPVTIDDAALCPSFAGRVLSNLDTAARTPLWMTEYLRRAGLRPISPVVDVTNYVMLERGQPLHAYDRSLIKGAIRPRFAKAGEKLVLLDERSVSLDADTLVISDDSGAIGLAGIMGGVSTAVNDNTTEVFLEAAFWPTDFMAGRARRYGLHTDASLRFERGVDPEGQVAAIERASELLQQISGAQAGPLHHILSNNDLPERAPIRLRRERLGKVLGVALPDAEVFAVLRRLVPNVAAVDDGWELRPPGFRFDLTVEVDLIEEVARICGYDQIPEITARSQTPLTTVSESTVSPDHAAGLLVGRDYQEVVTYSFVSAEANRAFCGEVSELVLANPISSELSVMRATLWPGLVAAAALNAARQQDRIRLFEIGRSFHGTLAEPIEIQRIAGLATGRALPEQWASKARPMDFFDIKSDLEALLALAGDTLEFEFIAADQCALQAGQAAKILRRGLPIGYVGKLHPRLGRQFELKRDVYLFELDATAALVSGVPELREVSRFPAIRRDIAVLVDAEIATAELVACARSAGQESITDVTLFDIYQGPGIEAGLKSVALGLILQETSRTLTDEDADSAQAAVVEKLKQKFAAQLRD